MKKYFLFLLIGVFIPFNLYADTANFGYETQGTTGEIAGLANWARCTDFVSDADMTEIVSMTIHISTMGATGLKPVIWNADDDTVLQVFPAITAGTGWQTSTLGSPVAITGGDTYCLGFAFGDATSAPSYDAGGLTAWADVTNSYATPQTFGIDDTSSNSLSVYATANLEEVPLTIIGTTTPLTGGDTLFLYIIIIFILSIFLWMFVLSPAKLKR